MEVQAVPWYKASGSNIKQEAPPLMSDGASLGDDEGLLHLVEGDRIALHLQDGSVGDGACLGIRLVRYGWSPFSRCPIERVCRSIARILCSVILEEFNVADFTLFELHPSSISDVSDQSCDVCRRRTIDTQADVVSCTLD